LKYIVEILPWQVVLDLYKEFEENMLDEIKFKAVLNYLAFASMFSDEAFSQFKDLIKKQHFNNNEAPEEEATLEELEKLGIIIEKQEQKDG
jgi:hypothetical protein